MKLGTLFSDGAVLQQGRINPLWGETLPGLLIEAAIAGKTAYAKASNDGHFMIHLPPLPAGGRNIKSYSRKPGNKRSKANY